MTIKEKDSLYIANTYARFPINLVSGKGSLCYDEKGKEYIDLATGIAVNTFGFCDSQWVNAVTKQLNTLQHTSNLYYSDPCVELAELLCLKTGMKKVFFSNSGAEANECAIKVARKYAATKKDSEYNTIITLKNSFHGRTVTTLAATGQDAFHKDFSPLTEGFAYVEANNCEELINTVKNGKIAGIMFETVQGEGGINPLTQEFVDTVFTLAEEYDLVTIADEVQTGNGRTGELYGYMNYGVRPDIFSTAKGIGGGLPLGATVLGERVEKVLTAGDHGSTFGGNPVACAGAVSILSRIDGELLAQVKAKSDYIVKELRKCEGVKSVTGKGLMLGIETQREAGEIISECQKRGVLVIKAKNKVRLLPALNIPQNILEKAINILCDVIKE